MAVVNLVGDFTNPWSADPNEEARRIDAWQWSPGTDTWRAVCSGSATMVKGLSSFLGAIEQQKPASIERLNLFSHGAPGLLAFSGTIDKADARVMLDTPNALDLRIRDTEPIPLGGGKERESLGGIARRLNNRFSTGGHIVLYLCNSGADFELLQVVANAFGVIAKGFVDKIYFCPDCMRNGKKVVRIDRGFTSVDKCRTKKAGFQHLIPTNVRSPAVQKP